MSPQASWWIVYGLGGVVPAVLMAWHATEALRELNEARKERASLLGSGPLRDGPVVVDGYVEPLEPGDFPVRVVIGQARKTSRWWGARWVEVNRVTEARPFTLRLTDGRRVRVEPGAALTLLDDLEPAGGVSDRTRRHRAQLSPGERVFIRGRLERVAPPDDAPVQSPEPAPKGYRDAPSVREGAMDQRAQALALALRPDTDGVMFIASEPVGQRFAARARFHVVSVLALGALLAIFQLGAFARYRALRARGVVVGAAVAGCSVTTGSHTHGGGRNGPLRGDMVTTSRVHYQLPDGFEFWDEGDCLPTGQTTFWRMDPSNRHLRLPGAGPARLPWDTGAFALTGISLLLAVYYLVAFNVRRPWYESLRFDSPGV